MKTPISYYGGKQKMLPIILKLIPSHNLYNEPFCGGAAVFFAKEKSKVEVLNDTNNFVTNFYEQCKINFEPLQKLIQVTMHSRDSYKYAKFIYENSIFFSKTRKAWAFYVLCNQGFGSKIGQWGYGRKKNSSETKTNNKRIAFTSELMERLSVVQIENKDAINVINSRDAVDTFHYADPPYYNADMGHYGGYTLENFTNLLKALEKIKGKFLLSSYPSEILTEFTKRNDWKQHSIEMATAISPTKKRKIEVLTANYNIHKMLE